MKKIITSLLAFSLISPTMPLGAQTQGKSKSPEAAKSCENGECIPKLIDDLNDLGEIYQQQCLPKGIKESEVASYHQKNGLSVRCFDMINKINKLETELQKHKTNLELKTSCENGNCKEKPGPIATQVNDLTKVKPDLMCSPERIIHLKNSCSNDLQCIAFSAGAPVSNLLFNSARPKNCDSSVDNHCGVQLVTGFFKAAVTFFKGSWELLKTAGNAIGNAFWEAVAGPEDHSSTSQLALAKASEDPGFFDQLTNDFPGTMKKVWEIFVNVTKDWLKNDVFCQSWSGTPHFSKCLQPSASFDCTPCNTLVTGFCTISGTLVAEVVPAFITGGLFTAMKHGARGVSSGVKVLKISDAGMEAIKASRISKITAGPTSTALSAAGKAGVGALNMVNTYLLNPARRGLKASFVAVSNLMKTGSPSLAVSPLGKTLVFTGTVAASTLRVVLYPIDNQMTQAAFRHGGKSFEKLMALGSPKLATATVVTSQIMSRSPQLESTLAKIEEANINGLSADKVLRLEKELLSKVGPWRAEAVKSALADKDVDLSEVIRRLYPELQFGPLAKSLPKEKVIEAENELYLELAQVVNTNHRAALLKKYEALVGDGVARRNVLGNHKPPFVIPKLERTAALDNYNVPLTPQQIQAKQSIREFMDRNFEEMVEKSRKVESHIRSAQAPVVYDTVAIGAGPKNAILVGAIKETNPNLNVLVLESTDSLGTFHRVKGFDINSAEWIGDSGNGFPTSSVNMRDFNINNSAYATAEEMGHATQATWHIADPDIVFKSTVTNVSKEPTPGAWPAKYKVETDNGLVVYARSAVVTPGLGSPVNRLKDAASVSTVAKYEGAAKTVDLSKDATYIPRFQDVETFINNAVIDMNLGRQAVGRYRKKTTLVVGDGDGGSIGIEAAAGLNKKLNPSEAATEIKVIWMGQPAKTGKEFIENLSRAKQPRYGRIGEAIDDGRVQTVNGYLGRVEEFTNEAGEIQFKAYYTTKKGEAIGEPVIVDNIVFATGYTHSHKTVAPYFSSMAKNGNVKGDEVIFDPLHGKLNDFTRYDGLKTETPAEINRQLVVNGQKEDIYLTGLGGKTPISKRKMKTVTGGFLDVAGTRAAATGQHIAESLTVQKGIKTAAIQRLNPELGNNVQIIKAAKVEEIPLATKEVVNINNKLELGKLMKGFRGQPDSQFHVSVMKNNSGEMIFNVLGVDTKSSEALIEKLSSNRKIVSGFSSELANSGNRIDLQIPTRSTGSILSEEIQIRTVNVLKDDVLDPTSHWPSAVMKVTSPSLRAAGQENKENPEENDEE